MLPFLPSRRALFGGVAIMGGGPPPKTYADWVAHIAARATGGAVLQAASTEGLDGLYRTTLGTGAGGLYGSSWMSFFYASSSSVVRRVIQHGMTSAASFDAQVASAREVLVSLAPTASQQIFTPLGRNGFTSSGGDIGEAVPTSICNLVGWWDEAAKTALMMNPQAGTGPVPYAAPGWN